MDDLIQDFIAETRETLAALGSEIVAWEAEPTDRARLDAIFRFVHTVKGSCGFLDLPRLSRLSHAAEDGLQAVRDGSRDPDNRFVDGVLAIVDRIGELVEAIDAGVGLDDSNDEELIRALQTRQAAVAEPAAGVAAAAEPAARSRASRTVRLGVELLDRMMVGMSDLVLVRNELARRVREGQSDPGVEAALERLSVTVGELRDTVSRTRVQKLESLFAGLPRIVRDTAADLGKTVTLSLEGGDVELDREMIEMVRDPLTHILRNGIDHGIEAPADRRAAGKAEAGRIRIAAHQVGNQIEIAIVDDGRGIDVDRLVQRAIARGDIDATAAQRMDEAQRLQLIFRPGLSTAEQVSELSGRGVGMDVVRANIERIGGVVDLRNMPGQGLRVVLRVPLTLSIIAAISLSAGDCMMALPRSAIQEVTAAGNPMIAIDSLGDATVVRLRGRTLPAIDLAAVLGRAPAVPRRDGIVMIVGCSGGSYALIADAIGDHEELVIKPAAPQVMAAGIYAGEALPDSGLPLLILDAAGLAAAAGVVFAGDDFTVATDVDAAAAAIPSREHLLYVAVDGERRIIPLDAVDRILSVLPDDACAIQGESFLRVDGRLRPLAGVAPDTLSRLRQALVIADGGDGTVLAIAEAQEIVSVPVEAQIARGGDVAALLVGDEAVAVTDLRAMTGMDGRAAAPAMRLDGETGWMDAVLRPLLADAGYHVRAPGEAPDAGDIVIASADRSEAAGRARSGAAARARGGR